MCNIGRTKELWPTLLSTNYVHFFLWPSCSNRQTGPVSMFQCSRQNLPYHPVLPRLSSGPRRIQTLWALWSGW
jgi:hypothetical protein